MAFRTVEHSDLEKTVLTCYSADPSIQKYSRNHEHGVEGRTKLEVECLKNSDKSFRFFDIYEDDKLVGYFGTEDQPVNTLSTFFIMPEYRKRKDEVWDFIVSHLPKEFFAGLFLINERAINFLKEKGGMPISEAVVEDKPSVIFYFNKG